VPLYCVSYAHLALFSLFKIKIRKIDRGKQIQHVKKEENWT
jgi:hypothetical protein